MLKKICFVLISSIPLCLLLGLIALITIDLVKVRRIDYTAIGRELQVHLNGKRPVSFAPPGELYAPLPPRSKRVFLFGESSLVLSDGMTFPHYLAASRRDLQVVNFGISGIDSISLHRRVEQALAVARPDIIVLYFGHNEYNNAYHGFILPRYFPKFDYLIRPAYLMYDENRPVTTFATGEYAWFSRLLRPRLYLALQRLRVMTLRHEDFSDINQVILDTFIRNSSAIMAMAAYRGIPVVFITPVCNLRAEPYGDLEGTSELHRRGLATEDRITSLSALRSARDAEFLTFDLRAKTPLLTYIRSIRQSGVHILDLEQELDARGFEFGDNDFADYFHLNDRSHRLVADIISGFLVGEKLVAGPP